MNIAVLGLGFVGLTTALGFADKGFAVKGCDINPERSAIIKSGKLPFFEPGLDTALERNNNKNFIISGTESAKDADAVFFCVGTPCGENGNADLSYMYSAIDSVIDVVKDDCVFVVKSTVPPGTTEEDIYLYLNGKGFRGSLANNPEFLREGFCWNDFVHADRIVCGVDILDTKAMRILSELYKPFDAPIHFVSRNTAEFIKYLSNSLLANLISFSNEMSIIADAVGGIETVEAFKILHSDKRLAGSGIASYVYPGCGYGGYCLPKDTAALFAKANSKGVNPHILNSVIQLNNNMPNYAAKKIISAAKDTDTKIGILGLSFKPESDDVRDSPAAKIIQILLNKGYTNIYAHDPIAQNMFSAEYNFEISYCESVEDVMGMSDIAAITTAWDMYKGVKAVYPDVLDLRYCSNNSNRGTPSHTLQTF